MRFLVHVHYALPISLKVRVTGHAPIRRHCGSSRYISYCTYIKYFNAPPLVKQNTGSFCLKCQTSLVVQLRPRGSSQPSCHCLLTNTPLGRFTMLAHQLPPPRPRFDLSTRRLYMAPSQTATGSQGHTRGHFLHGIAKNKHQGSGSPTETTGRWVPLSCRRWRRWWGGCRGQRGGWLPAPEAEARSRRLAPLRRRGRRRSRWRRRRRRPGRPRPAGCGGRRSSWGSAASRSTSLGSSTTTLRAAVSRNRRRPGRPCAAPSRRRQGSAPTPASTSYWAQRALACNALAARQRAYSVFVGGEVECASSAGGL